jgi:autotransporter-associated beta strand protein
MNGPVTVKAGNTLTLAASAGLSMVVANFDVTLNCLLSASTFNIASGRILTLGGGSTAFLSGTSTGQGTLLLNATSAKTFTANGNPSVNMGNPATGIGGVVISNNCTLIDSGSFIIGNSGNGVVTLNSPTAAFNTTGGAGVIMVGRNSGATTRGRLTLINGNINTAASTAAGIIVGFQLNNAAAKGVLDVQGGTLAVPQMLNIGGGMSAGSGAVTIEGGTVTVGTNNFGGTTGGVSTGGSASLTMTGGTLFVGSGGMNSVGTGTFTSTRTLSGGTIGATANWSSSLPMTLTNVNSNITFQAADAGAVAHNITLSGALSGSGGLIKSGAGILTLSGANTYTGGTAINAGTLTLTTTNNVAMAYTNNGGNLNVRRASAGSYMPASSFTFGNNGPQLTFDLAGLGASLTPLLTNSGNLTLNGNVMVNVSNAPVSGTSVLFSYAGTRTGSGNFVAGIIPSGSSIIDDPIGRKISLAYPPAAPPMFTEVSHGASSLSFSGTNGTPFITYRILRATNLINPTWFSAWTNAFDPAGNFNATIPVDFSNPTAFYRLVTP